MMSRREGLLTSLQALVASLWPFGRGTTYHNAKVKTPDEVRAETGVSPTTVLKHSKYRCCRMCVTPALVRVVDEASGMPVFREVWYGDSEFIEWKDLQIGDIYCEYPNDEDGRRLAAAMKDVLDAAKVCRLECDVAVRHTELYWRVVRFHRLKKTDRSELYIVIDSIRPENLGKELMKTKPQRRTK